MKKKAAKTESSSSSAQMTSSNSEKSKAPPRRNKNDKKYERVHEKSPENVKNNSRKTLFLGFLVVSLMSVVIVSYHHVIKDVILTVVGDEMMTKIVRIFSDKADHGSERTDSNNVADKSKPTNKGSKKTEDVKREGDASGEAISSHTNDESKGKTAAKPKYLKRNITNKYDNPIRSSLDQADAELDKGKLNEAISSYDRIISRHPHSPRAYFGKANALRKLSEERRSNEILEQSIEVCLNVLTQPDLPKSLAIAAGKECAEWQSFRGWGGKAVKTMKQLIDLYPEEKQLWNDLGVKHLMAGQIENARQTFIHVLKMDPSDGFAMVHLGFIIKTTDRNYKDSIPYLQKGIATEAPGVIDGRFFFHLGDALFRIGSHLESYEVYQLGADKGVFRSFWQRSLYNVDSLAARPWWTKTQTGNAKFLAKLEENWEVIRDEGLANLDEKKGVFEMESEDLRDEGDWRQFTLYSQGRKIEKNCQKVPKTCALLEGFTEATGCKRGQIKYSVMHPGVHVWPHCGPTNCRIRSHLGLVIPDGPRIRIANETRTWKLGKFIVFDDSFEHEVWHEGTSLRLVLIVDMWHPELTLYQKQTLSPI